MCDEHGDNSRRVFTTIPAELHKKLQDYADRNELSMSAVVRMALKRFSEWRAPLTKNYRPRR